MLKTMRFSRVGAFDYFLSLPLGEGRREGPLKESPDVKSPLLSATWGKSQNCTLIPPAHRLPLTAVERSPPKVRGCQI